MVNCDVILQPPLVSKCPRRFRRLTSTYFFLGPHSSYCIDEEPPDIPHVSLGSPNLREIWELLICQPPLHVHKWKHLMHSFPWLFTGPWSTFKTRLNPQEDTQTVARRSPSCRSCGTLTPEERVLRV